MTEIYKLDSCIITHNEIYIRCKYGVISSESGQIQLEVFQVEEDKLDFEVLRTLLNRNFSIDATTISKDTITGSNFRLTYFSTSNSAIGFSCFDKIFIDKFRQNEERKSSEEIIYFVEVEGLHLVHSEITDINRTRRGTNLDEYQPTQMEMDHTTTTIFYNQGENNCNYFPVIFYKHPLNESTIIDFTKCERPNHLEYSYFLKFKNDFISFLSFINGGDVSIRSEHTGGYRSLTTIDSQYQHLYSFIHNVAGRTSDYIPIGSRYFDSGRVLRSMFNGPFDNYIVENSLLDLTSIVFYLNGALKANSVEERFFVLIIALERLAYNHLSRLESIESKTLLPNEKFNLLKKDVIRIIKTHKRNVVGLSTEDSKEMKLNYDKLSTSFGQMNSRNKSVGHKFRTLLQDFKIPITDDISCIINNLRNISIHRGEINDGYDGIKYTLILDELIRETIVKIISYDGQINSKIHPERNKY